MAGIKIAAAAVSTFLLLVGFALPGQADFLQFAKRGADDVAEGGQRGEHHAGDAAPATDGQSSKGKALFEAKCSTCHELFRSLGKSKDLEGWTATVKRMQGNGARITDPEAQEIIGYLVKIRGPERPKP